MNRQEKIPVSRTMVDHVLREKQGILVSDAGRDERFQAVQSVVRFGIREAICVPMKGRHGTLGVLYLDTRTRQEGLDLLYRVQRAFSGVDPKRAAVLLAAGTGWLFGLATLSCQAAPLADRVGTVGTVRQEIVMIRGQVKDAEHI